MVFTPHVDIFALKSRKLTSGLITPQEIAFQSHHLDGTKSCATELDDDFHLRGGDVDFKRKSYPPPPFRNYLPCRPIQFLGDGNSVGCRGGTCPG